MESILEKFSNSSHFNVIVGILAGVLAGLFIQAYLMYLPNMSWTVTGYITASGFLAYLMFFWAAPVATFGVPVSLYLRKSYIAPAITCLLVTALWTYGELTQGGDSSAAVIMLAFTPIYIALYAVVTGLEYGIRQHLTNDKNYQ